MICSPTRTGSSWPARSANVIEPPRCRLTSTGMSAPVVRLAARASIAFRPASHLTVERVATCRAASGTSRSSCPAYRATIGRPRRITLPAKATTRSQSPARADFRPAASPSCRAPSPVRAAHRAGRVVAGPTTVAIGAGASMVRAPEPAQQFRRHGGTRRGSRTIRLSAVPVVVPGGGWTTRSPLRSWGPADEAIPDLDRRALGIAHPTLWGEPYSEQLEADRATGTDPTRPGRQHRMGFPDFDEHQAVGGKVFGGNDKRHIGRFAAFHASIRDIDDGDRGLAPRSTSSISRGVGPVLLSALSCRDTRTGLPSDSTLNPRIATPSLKRPTIDGLLVRPSARSRLRSARRR